MLSFSTLSILFSNSVTLRRDISIFFNRVAIVVLLYCFLEAIIGIFLINKGIGLHGGLLQITNITQTFHSFIFIISALILILTASFFPRKG
jgi:NADH-ubiquinone oxidoreductase chain 2